MLGENISNLRKSKGLSLNMLAKKCSISAGYLSDIEKNIKKNPSIDILNKISTILGVPVAELLTVEERLDAALISMDKIAQMAKKGLNYNSSSNSNHMINESCPLYRSDINSILDNFENETFSKDEQSEITNFINFLISKRK